MSRTIKAEKGSWQQGAAAKKCSENILGIVLDATLSFTSVYPQIYYFLERLLIALKQIREEEGEKKKFVYVLTLLKDEPEQVFFGREKVTDDEDELLEALMEMEFSGGSTDGRENLTGALRALLQEMEKHSSRQSQMGILLISDAASLDENRFADLTHHAGLRFACIYSGDNDYMPQFRLVDGKGHLTENEGNTCIYAKLPQLLADSEEEEVRLAEKLAQEMVMRFA